MNLCSPCGASKRVLTADGGPEVHYVPMYHEKAPSKWTLYNPKHQHVLKGSMDNLKLDVCLRIILPRIMCCNMVAADIVRY
jgi:hypothetical protein